MGKNINFVKNGKMRFKVSKMRFKGLSLLAGILPLKFGDVKKPSKHKASRGGFLKDEIS